MSNISGFIKRLRDIMRNRCRHQRRRTTYRADRLAFVLKGL